MKLWDGGRPTCYLSLWFLGFVAPANRENVWLCPTCFTALSRPDLIWLQYIMTQVIINKRIELCYSPWKLLCLCLQVLTLQCPSLCWLSREFPSLDCPTGSRTASAPLWRHGEKHYGSTHCTHRWIMNQWIWQLWLHHLSQDSDSR